MKQTAGRRLHVSRLGVAVVVCLALLGIATAAHAHSGGLDSNGGHYCREAGYEAGTCSPLGSYHCHESGCVDYDGPTGNASDGGEGDSGGAGSEWDVYQPAPSGVTGEKMRAKRMLRELRRGRERRPLQYERYKFPHWADLNGDGCDTRQAVLIEESTVEVSRRADCTVTGGRWYSVYDGKRWTNPSDVDIDHVVALKEAWVSGAYDWSKTKRRRFANDLKFRPSLRAVTDNVNQSKSDRDPAEWLPSRARCSYAINWVQVKYRWRLRANAGELDALGHIIRGECGDRHIAIPKRVD